MTNKCACQNYGEFSGEVAIRFPGSKGLRKPTVLTFPKLRILSDGAEGPLAGNCVDLSQNPHPLAKGARRAGHPLFPFLMFGGGGEQAKGAYSVGGADVDFAVGDQGSDVLVAHTE